MTDVVSPLLFPQGIGRGVSVRLASEGAAGITLVDVSLTGLEETRALVLRANPRCVALVQIANVANENELSKSFAAHKHRFNSMHACFNNAGVGERKNWKSVVDINLNAVIQGTRLAVDVMQSTKSPGTIVNVASAGGVFPMPQAPVYSATKAAVILFSQSLKHLSDSNKKYPPIRVNALCPQFTDTNLVSGQFEEIGKEKANALLKQTGGSLLPVEKVVDAAMELVREDKDKPAGAALAVMNANGGTAVYVPTPNPKYWKQRVAGGKGNSGALKKAQLHPPSPVPSHYRKVQVHTLSSDFGKATEIMTVQIPVPKANQVLIERRFTGVNASDVNFSAGRYFGSPKKAKALLPFDAGFESVGVVAALGPGVESSHPELNIGTPVATTTYGGFSEYSVSPVSVVVPIPEASPEAVALLTSGLTASIALEQLGDIFALPGTQSSDKQKKVVLVTAAAGGTGQIAVQLAKLAGHHVVATCGGENKARLLKSLGVDRVVNYKTENLKHVLRSEFKKGVDLIYESVGGAMFETCVDSLGTKGVLIVIGMMSQYKKGGDGLDSWTPSVNKGLPEKLLWKSAGVRGFFLPQYAKHFRRHLNGLFTLLKSGALKISIDPQPFIGLDSVTQAVNHLQGGASIGKVVVDVRGHLGSRSKL